MPQQHKFKNIEVRRRYNKFMSHLRNQRKTAKRQGDANDLARPIFPSKHKLAEKSSEELKTNNAYRILNKYWTRQRDIDFERNDVVDASLLWEVMPTQEEHYKKEERRLRDKGLL